MKVINLTWFPKDPAVPHGGVEAVSVSLVSALGKLHDLEIHVVTTDRACKSLSITTWERTTVHRLPWAGGKTLTHAVGAGRRQMTEYLTALKPDVVHAHERLAPP
ncbi:MAG: hypothetical protein NTX87_02465 [Planctomycetota bacterium]|nr:hypothetical protein [Planctomycetota bacterium]